MLGAIRRVCEFQPLYSPDNTSEMEERGRLVRRDIVEGVRALEPLLSPALGKFGHDFFVEASDGIGRKTELPWVRYCSNLMSPTPREGFYCVIHFSTDGSAIHVTVGCSSSQFINGTFRTLGDLELRRRTVWARQVILDTVCTTEPFTDEPNFGATRPLPKSFEQATALSKRMDIAALNIDTLRSVMVKSAEYLKIVYQGESDGKDRSPADKDEQDIIEIIRPTTSKRGQGFGLSAVDKRLVELRAMEKVADWLKQNNYQYKDTSANQPYDFEVKKGGVELKVEVKGTTSEYTDAISMTRNEVNLHRKNRGATALFIVSRISLVGEDENRHASGGEVEALIGWDIDEWKTTVRLFVRKAVCEGSVRKRKKPPSARRRFWLPALVAGVGFEPTTFRL